jgi:hypothetical protein
LTRLRRWGSEGSRLDRPRNAFPIERRDRKPKFPRLAGFAFSPRDHVADDPDARAEIVPRRLVPNLRQVWPAGLSATPSIFVPPQSMPINIPNPAKRTLGDAISDLAEIVVTADLATLQRDLQAVERWNITMREAKRRAWGSWQWQQRRQGENIELLQRVA